MLDLILNWTFFIFFCTSQIPLVNARLNSQETTGEVFYISVVWHYKDTVEEIRHILREEIRVFRFTEYSTTDQKQQSTEEHKKSKGCTIQNSRQRITIHNKQLNNNNNNNNNNNEVFYEEYFIK
jgi:hypothetical protein